MIAIIDGDVLVYISMWNTNTKEEARENFDDLFTAITEDLFAEDYAMALGGNSNFRSDLYPLYKANRAKSKSERPDWFLDLKSDIVRDYDNCEFSDYCEADDMVRVWSNDCKKVNKEFVIVSVDKDLDCIEGKHYNPRKQIVYDINEEESNFNYWKQVLMGDATDNIPGIPKVGPKKAEAILKNSNCYKTAVCKAYSDYYQDEGYNYLLLNGRLIHIWRYIGDYFNIKREFYDSVTQ